MEYRFGRPRHACRQCDRSFHDGELYTSALAPAADASSVARDADRARSFEEIGDFDRLDYCNDCFKALDADDHFSWWTAQKLAKPKRAPTLDPDFLWSLLQAMARLARRPAAGTGATSDTQAVPGDTNDRSEVDGDAANSVVSDSPLAATPATIATLAPRDAVALAYLAALGLMRLKQVRLVRHSHDGDTEMLHFQSRVSRGGFTLPDPALTDEEIARLETKLEPLRDQLDAAPLSAA